MAAHRRPTAHDYSSGRLVGAAVTAAALLLSPVAATALAPVAHGAGGPGDPGGSRKQVIRLPGVKIEIKNQRGDGKPPVVKIVPRPGLHRGFDCGSGGGGTGGGGTGGGGTGGGGEGGPPI